MMVVVVEEEEVARKDTLAGCCTQWADSNTNRQVSHVGQKCGTVSGVATSDKHIGASLAKAPARIVKGAQMQWSCHKKGGQSRSVV